MKQVLAKVIANKTIAENIVEIELHAPDLFERHSIEPGNFVHVALKDQSRLLRRPISIYTADPQKKIIGLAVQVVGEGTRQMAEWPEGSDMDVIGPVGNSFDLSACKKVYAVGGGVGVAPVRFALDVYADAIEMEGFFGYRSKALIYGNDFTKAPIHIATDDGSAGDKGTVLVPLERRIREEKPDLVICCGPTPMMRAVRNLCAQYGVPSQLSLEERMGCGVGACNGCTAKIGTEQDWAYKRVCVDGPVFKGAEVLFDE